MLLLDARVITFITLWEEIKWLLLTKNNQEVLLARLTQESPLLLARVPDTVLAQLPPHLNPPEEWEVEPLPPI